MTKVYIASDHAGVDLKSLLKNRVESNGLVVEDLGPDTYEAVDYPDYAHKVAKKISNEPDTIGVLLCGSGNGVSITSNKWKNVRAAICWNSEIATLARLHNNANILCIPSRFVSAEDAIDILDYFLETKFEGGRHERRVNKIHIPTNLI